MLKNTLVLPDKVSDGALARRLLIEAIEALDVVLMLVLGKDQRAEQIVGWADQLCAKMQVTPSINLRRVVWIREHGVKEIDGILQQILGKERPRVVVLGFHDDVKAKLQEKDIIDPLALEKAFALGHTQ